MIIALNNKSNLGKYDFLKYQQELSTIKTSNKIVLCPTYLNINLFHLTNVELGAQNVSATDEGAFTGEVSAKDLKESGVGYCIIGHSERREHQSETNELIHEKLIKLLENDITPILCVGETQEERENNKVEEVLREEINSAIIGLTEDQKKRLIVAYEPIWSIGTGLIPTVEEIDNALAFIKSIIPSAILYGGSANASNINTLKDSKLIEGFLLGGLSLKLDELQTFLNVLETNKG